MLMSTRNLLIGLALVASCGTAEAQVARVFVSVNGNDANVCSNIATPCRTFAGGITQVDAQGEVIVIDSGSYAGGTITKSVKINVAAGVVAFSGLPITVDPGAGGVVVLRGLTLKAATPGSGTGITHNSGALFVENSVVDGWGLAGIDAKPGAEKLFVKGSVFRNTDNNGIAVSNSTVEYAIDESFFENNGVAGVSISGGKGRISSSTLSGSPYGAWLSNPGTVANFERCEISGNSVVGVRAYDTAVVRLAGSTIVGNGIGLQNDYLMDPGTIEVFGNNLIRGNTTNTTGTITTVPLQ
jgi:hypothetical protein